MAALAERSVDRLDAALRRGCWIYGAGDYGRNIHQLLERHGIRCRGFIDQRASELTDAGLPVFAPAAIGREEATDSAVIIALHNFAFDQTPVFAWARATGFADILVPAELPDLLGPSAGSYWLKNRSHLLEHLDDLAILIEMLDDPRSVETVVGIARYRMTALPAAHPHADISDQYFPRDLVLPKEPLRLIDGGAFIGEAWNDACRAGTLIDEWYCFEPDPVNFDKLSATVRASDTRRAVLFPCGLGDRCGQASFAAGAAAGSRMADSDAADMIVQVVAVDDVLPGANPNFIKLDIEGAESAALDGMQRTLAEARPQLAMSIYHLPGDLWELPFKVKQMLPGASLHVRQHGFNGFDTVLYAIPQRRT